MVNYKVFISYSHEEHQDYKNKLAKLLEGANLLESKALMINNIKNANLSDDEISSKVRDEYLKDTEVTLVLVGKDTYRKKHVDWEIASSLKDYNPYGRSGLVVVFLPDYSLYDVGQYSAGDMHPRLYDNVHSGYATMVKWTEDEDLLIKSLRNSITAAHSNKFSRDPVSVSIDLYREDK